MQQELNNKMKKIIFYKNILLIFFLVNNVLNSAKAAESLIFINGSLSRSISIENLEVLVTENELRGSVKNLIKLSNQESAEIQKLLSESYKMKLVTTSRLLYSKIGNVILERVSKIIYPHKVPDKNVSIPAIRSAVISGLYKGQGEINLLLFLKEYPNKIITVNVPALFQVIDKVESLTDLVKFFSDSPLKKLQQREVKDID